MDESSIKNNINTYRKNKDLTQTEAARALNISTNAYRGIEKGKTSIINSHVRDLAELLELSIEELFLGYSPSATMDATIHEIKEEYGSKVSRLENRIGQLEKLIDSLEETIATKNEIITMLKNSLDGEK